MPIEIIALVYPKPGKADRVEELILEVTVKVKANEPGALRYQLQREVEGDAPTLIVLEAYEDKAAIDAHLQTDYYKALGKTLKEEDLLAAPVKVIVTKEAGGFASRS